MIYDLKPGDYVVINSTTPAVIQYNGQIFQFVSWYPHEDKLENISNLHDVILIDPRRDNILSYHTSYRFSPSDIIKLDMNEISIKFDRQPLAEEDAQALSVIEKYLDEESMQMVARQVFQAKMNMLFDRVYQARTKAGNSLYDEIMMKITDEQLKKFEPELNGIFMKRVEQEILRTDKPEEGDQTFREWLRFALQRKAEEWIKEHQIEVYDLMQDSIQVAASHLCEDKLCEALGDQVGKILKEKF